jgi:hypothetical protein
MKVHGYDPEPTLTLYVRRVFISMHVMMVYDIMAHRTLFNSCRKVQPRYNIPVPPHPLLLLPTCYPHGPYSNTLTALWLGRSHVCCTRSRRTAGELLTACAGRRHQPRPPGEGRGFFGGEGAACMNVQGGVGYGGVRGCDWWGAGELLRQTPSTPGAIPFL